MKNELPGRDDLPPGVSERDIDPPPRQGLDDEQPHHAGDDDAAWDRLACVDMRLPEAVDRACQEPTLLDALTFICIWETERIVRQARGNEQWDTCFRVCLQAVKAQYERQHH